MSHHINFDLATHSGKSPSPKGDKKESKSAKKRETKKLEIDNKQMEWRLNQLKLAMEKEKEERGKKAYIWQSGKNGALESHARNILGRTVKSKSAHGATDSKKTKVTVLLDEPLDLPKRKSHSKDLIEKLKQPIPPKKPASADRPIEIVNKECWISVGFDRFSDDIMELQSDQNGNLPLTALQGLNPSAIGLFYMRYGRKRLLLAIDDKVIQPKSGWGNDVYYPYVANVSPRKTTVEPISPALSRSQVNHAKKSEEFENNRYITDHHQSPTPSYMMNDVARQKTPEENTEGGNLLDGNFDEEANALAFKQAVLAWRTGTSNAPMEPKPRESKSVSSVTTADHDAQSEPMKTVKVKFSETSTLTYMEKILLQKHRKTAVPPLPDFSSQLGSNFDSVDESTLTTDERDEQRRYRELFLTQPSDHTGVVTNDESVCTIAEVNSDEVLPATGSEMQSNTYCYVEEASDSEDFEQTESSKTKQDDYAIEEYIPGKSEHMVNNNQTAQPDNKKSNTAKENSYQSVDSNHNFIERKNPALQSSSRRLGKKANVIEVISKVPLNPDAFYRVSLDEYCVNMEQERHKLFSNLNLNPEKILMCKNGNSQWLVGQNHGKENDGNDSAGKVKPKESEEAEREQEDNETLEKLEWELASQTGNITSDGRISRLIDGWSADDNELGIVNDPGFGSGLSTPDPEPINLVGTSLTWQDDGNMMEEFQRMEHLMLDDQTSYGEFREADSR